MTAVASSPALGARSGSLVGSVIPVTRVDHGGREPAGAGHADDLGGDRVGPVAQHQQRGLVADARDAVRRQQLDPGAGAAGVPAERGLVGALGRGLASAEASADWPAVERLGRRSGALRGLRRRAGERAHQRTDAVHVGVPAALAGEDQSVAGGVGAGRALGPAARGWPADTCSTPSSASGVSGSGGGRAPSPWAAAGWSCSPSRMPLEARAGRTPAASVTSEPETRTAATAAATPTAVCVRRRAEPARITIEGRGQRTDSSAGASASSTLRIAVDGTSRCTANCAVAVCSSRSAVARVRPTSRAMCVDRAARSGGSAAAPCAGWWSACRARRGWPGSRGRGPSAGPTSGRCCGAGPGSRPAGARSPRARRAARPCASGARPRPTRRAPRAARRAGRR